jgi:hypothetical protein
MDIQFETARENMRLLDLPMMVGSNSRWFMFAGSSALPLAICNPANTLGLPKAFPSHTEILEDYDVFFHSWCAPTYNLGLSKGFPSHREMLEVYAVFFQLMYTFLLK